MNSVQNLSRQGGRRYGQFHSTPSIGARGFVVNGTSVTSVQYGRAEFTVPRYLLDFTVPTQRLEFTVPGQRPEFTATKQ